MAKEKHQRPRKENPCGKLMDRKVLEKIVLDSLLTDNGLIDSTSFLESIMFRYFREQFECLKEVYNNTDKVSNIDLVLKGYKDFISITDSEIGQTAVEKARTLFDAYQLETVKNAVKGIQYKNIDTVLTDLTQIIDTVDSSYENNQKLKPVNIEKFLRKMEEIRHSKEDLGIMVQSFPTFNKITGGMLPGDLVGIYGKEKSTKTTFTHQIIIDISLSKKVPSVIFNFEMDALQLLMKTMSMVTGIDISTLRYPRGKDNMISDSVFSLKSDNLKSKFEGVKLFIEDKMLNEMQIYSKTKELIKSHGIRIVIIDYLMLIEASKQFGQRRDELNYLSRFFKRMAAKLKITILLISQANDTGMREAEAKGLSRDSNYYFYVEELEKGNKVKIKDVDYIANDNEYLIINRGIRHGKGNRGFLTKFVDNIYKEFSIDKLTNKEIKADDELPF